MLPSHIIFLRHGIAIDPTDFDGSDFDRYLTEKGRSKTKIVCQKILSKYIPTLIFASPLVRAQQTALAMTEEMVRQNFAKAAFHTTKELDLAATWQSWSNFFWNQKFHSEDIVLCVGHEPSISSLLFRQLGCQENLGGLKKAGFAIIKPYSQEAADLIAFVPPSLT